MQLLTVLANFFAKYSVARWNKNRYLRGFCRLLYYGIIEMYYYCPAERAKRRHYFAGHPALDIYPEIFEKIAKWPEGDDGIVVDFSRFVIRRSPSYCVYMIRALTGRKPKVSSGWRCRRRRRYDAKDWQEFLRLCGYEKIVTELEKGRYNIGIDPNCGEFGQLYWLTLGGLGVPTSSGGIKRIVVATTYENFKFKVDMMTDERLSELTIIEIG